MENLRTDQLNMTMRKAPTLFFKKDVNGVSTKLYDGENLIGEIIFMALPIDGRHFLLTYGTISTTLCEEYEIAKEALVTRYFFEKLER